MRHAAFGAAIVAVTLVVAAHPATQSRAGAGRPIERVNGHDAAAGEVIVKLRGGPSGRARADVARAGDADQLRAIGRGGIHRLRSRSANVAALIQRLAAHPDVEYVEPNYIVRAIAEPPDPLLPQLWGLLNSGQAVNGGLPGVPGRDINAPQAWDLTTGTPAHVVAVIDTGVDYTHPDLAANMWTAPAPFTVSVEGLSVTCPAGTHGFNAITLTCNPMDDHNHGTHVAGTIGASGANGIGVVGVNWTTRLMGVKFLDSSGSGTIADAVTSLEFVLQARAAFNATRAADVRVLSNSWGSREFSQALAEMIAATRDDDMLFVAAAGNSAFSNDLLPMYPASYDVDNVISVAATTNTDARAWFSNYGAASVDLGAPGVDILSTTIGNTYAFASGTSMATPHVSGAAALVLSVCTLDTPALKSALLGTVERVPALASMTATGGRLDVHSAIRSCIGPPDAPASLTAAAGDASVTLAWPSAAGALRYTVKRSETSGGPYAILAADVSSTTFADDSVVNDRTYFYVVSASNSQGESGLSPEASATPKAPSDLVISSLTVPAVGGAGLALPVSVATRNQAAGTSAATTTRFYLSENFLLDANDTPFPATQNVPALASGGTHTSDLSLTVPQGTPTGLYFVIAAADADGVELETSESNNRTWKQVRVGPDLAVSSLGAPSTAGAGGSIVVSTTTENRGGGNAPSSITRFYLSSNTALDGSDVALAGGHAVPALAPDAAGEATSTLTIPSSTAAGSYYLIAIADGDGAVVETSEANNNGLRLIRIGGDLVISALSAPAAAGSGASIALSDTTTNGGAGAIGASLTRFFLSSNTLLDAADTPLGARAVPPLAAGAGHTGTTIVGLPGGLVAGSYYVIALADADNALTETLETNNTRTRSIAMGPDLTISGVSVPYNVVAGGAVSLAMTVLNKGGGSAAASTATVYLSPNISVDGSDVPLGSQLVGGLSAGAQAAATLTIAVPAGTAPGTYWILVKADGNEDVAESYEGNNVSARAVRVAAGS